MPSGCGEVEIRIDCEARYGAFGRLTQFGQPPMDWIFDIEARNWHLPHMLGYVALVLSICHERPHKLRGNGRVQHCAKIVCFLLRMNRSPIQTAPKYCPSVK